MWGLFGPLQVGVVAGLLVTVSPGVWARMQGVAQQGRWDRWP